MTELTKVTIGYEPVESVYLGNNLIFEDWTPLSLFKVAGTRGVWYDFTDITTLYQNSNGTSRVYNNGDLVGCVKDKSGFNVNLIQGINANRPSYSIYDKGSIKFNGVNTFLYAFDSYFDNYTAITLAYRHKTVYAASKTVGSSIFSMGGTNGYPTALSIAPPNNINTSNTEGRGVFVIASIRTKGMILLGNSNYTRAANTWENGVVESGSAGTTATQNGLALTFNANYYASALANLSPIESDTNKNGSFRIGMSSPPVSSTGSTYLNGNMTGIIILNRTLTPIERVKLEKYLSSTT